MESHKTVLHIHACTAFCGTAKQNTDITVTHLCKQFFFACVGVGFMDKGYLCGRHTLCDELLPYILINAKLCLHRCYIIGESIFKGMEFHTIDSTAACLCHLVGLRSAFGGGEVTEQELCQLIVLSDLPYTQDIVYTGVYLTALVIGQHGVNYSLVKP